jgi:hypothetical protein
LPRENEPVTRPVNPRQVFRRICLNVLADPVSTARERLEAVRLYETLTDHEVAPERGFDAEIAAMTDEALDEALGYYLAPISSPDPHDWERELDARHRELEREFEARVEARARELVDMSAVEVHIEQCQSFTNEHAQSPSRPDLTQGWQRQRRVLR